MQNHMFNTQEAEAGGGFHGGLRSTDTNADIYGGITHMCVNFQDEIHWNEGCVKRQICGFLTHTIHPKSP
jgi:hypothetical protein